MLKTYSAVVRNHFFANNSGKLEPIGTKLYRETSAQVTCSRANFCRPLPNGRKMAAKKYFANFLFKNNASFHSLFGASFFKF